MDLPLSEGELTPCLFDHVVCGPLGEHPEQMPYPGGNRAYPVHPPLLCRLGIVLPWAATAVVFDVDDDIDVDVDVEVDVEVEVEPGFTPLLCMGVEADPPQLTNVRVTKVSIQIFTRNSPALISKPGVSAPANAKNML
jgi:hypothetical protein